MQPRAFETLKCLITGDWKSLNEEPTLRENFFNKDNMDQYTEDDLESIIDETPERSTSMDLRSSTMTSFQNPLRRSDQM